MVSATEQAPYLANPLLALQCSQSRKAKRPCSDQGNLTYTAPSDFRGPHRGPRPPDLVVRHPQQPSHAPATGAPFCYQNSGVSSVITSSKIYTTPVSSGNLEGRMKYVQGAILMSMPSTVQG